MRRSFAFNIFLFLLFICTASILAVFVSNARSIKKIYYSEKKHSLLQLAEVAAAALRFSPDLHVEEFAVFFDGRITVISPEGEILFENMHDSERMDNHLDRPEFISAAAGSPAVHIRYSRTLRTDMMYAAAPVYDHNTGTLHSVLRISKPVKAINQIVYKLYQKLFFFSSIIILFVGLGSFLLSRKLIKPLSKIAAAAENFGKGQIEPVEEDLNYPDEFRTLFKNFQDMQLKISSLIRETTAEKEEISSIINAVTDGIMAVHKNGKILFINEHAKKNLSFYTAKSLVYYECIRNADINDFITNSIRSEKEGTAEITSGNRTFFFSANWLSTRQSSVILVRDITERAALDENKRQFIANISHELKTPLTAISGFSDSAKNIVHEKLSPMTAESDKKLLRYIEIIQRNTHRMILLTKDLISLASLDSLFGGLALDRIPLGGCIQNAIDACGVQISAKGLALNIQFGELPIIYADAFRLEQVFINLIANAVNYTEQGAITITAGQSAPGKVFITVRDTGIGIPGEALQHIFSRFYVVDKSRSRERGGTGLGLSIVRQIVALHKGTVSVQSELGKGSAFTVELPL